MWESHDFSIIYDLTWIVDKTTRVPDTMGHLANLIHLFLTSCPEKNAQIKCYLAWPILTTHWWMLKLTANWKCHKTIFWYPKVDGDSIRSYIANLLSVFFKNRTASLISEWILPGMDNIITKRKYQQKPKSQLWFMPECASAKAHHNRYYHLYHREWCSRSFTTF